jgi:tRNA(Ile)-lysidine synthase
VSELIRRIEKQIRTRELLPDAVPVVVAVSGGVDSMILLHALDALRRKHRWKLLVAHYNHMLRGAESDADEALVGETARKLRIPFESATGDVKRLARAEKVSVEMAARALRHEFLARTARNFAALHIALAHHADDQVELFFLRLFRGAGSEGLAGMKWRARSAFDPGLTLVRPLLGETKAALVEFARGAEIPFRDDRTNQSTDLLRNRIRRKLIPLLRRDYQPELHRTVLRAMEIIGDEASFIEASAKAWLARRGRSPWNQLPTPVQRSVIQHELLRLGIRPCFDWVERLRLDTAWVSLGENLACRRKANGALEKRITQAAVGPPEGTSLDLNRARPPVAFGSRLFRWRLQPGNTLPHRRPANAEFFDAGAVGPRILLRTWRPGDRFQPIGLTGTAKLQDLFVNQKVPAELRRQRVVATTESDEIFWVEGLRIGERFKVTPGTKRVLRWAWESK